MKGLILEAKFEGNLFYLKKSLRLSSVTAL